MSVIIRLQNLPWTANARDIRNFFSGLAIPEGGVHIIGGEMGDAFIAFSTDEDARCAMLKDREKLMEIQVRLLLSSRAEMQKVIETARKGASAPAPIAVPVPMPVVTHMAASKTGPATPMPPIIGGLGSFLSQAKVATSGGVPSFLAYQQQAGITLSEVTGRRSRSRSSSSDDSDRERERERERERGRKRRSDRFNNSQERELKMVSSGGAPPSPWAQPSQNQLPGMGLGLNVGLSLNMPTVLSSPQSYTTSSTTNNVTNNYNLAPSAPNAQLLAALQQVVSGSPVQVQPAKVEGEPIAFASVNPYAQMYPQLFQQQQMLLQQQQTPAKLSPSMSSSPGGGNTPVAIADTCYIRISGMLQSTSYSDIRKYFQGLYIPHNGIKIMTSNGSRTGVAYVEFSRVSSAQKAVQRNNTMLKDQLIQIVPVGDEEFERAEELANRQQNEGGRNHNHNGGDRSERGGGGGGGGGMPKPMPIPVTNVLRVEDLSQHVTEQEIMKMFSASYTVVDILLSRSPNNRRESVAFVLFARESEAESALQDTSKHYIGFRQLRVSPSNQAEMQNAKEKQRRANEQLLKEEADQRDELLKDQQRRQKLQQQEQENNQASRFAADPRRRQAEEQQQQHQQQQQQQQMNMGSNINHNMNMNPNMNHNMIPPFVNGGNMPFNMPHQQQNGGHNFPFNMNNNFNMNGNPNGNGPNFPIDNGGGGGFQRPRQEDVFVRVHNCEYATRVNDLGELFSLENLRIEHIEQLFNDRNQSSGEFIVEFCDPASCKQAIREFHNRRFRGRGLRVVAITPQEIADKMNKPFMDYLPGGNGPRKVETGNVSDGGSGNGGSGRSDGGQEPQQSRRRKPSRFDDISSRNDSPQDQPPKKQERQQSLEKEENSNGSSNAPVKQHFNPFARPDPALSSSSLSPSNQSQSKQTSPAPVTTSLIPDKFNRPGCVVAMRNVPYKAELKDILRFFSDYKLSPDDVIRRFNDEGQPTGDTRVAFESPAEALSAFESCRRKQIFNRTVFLDIVRAINPRLFDHS
ncbi:mastermind-like protein 2 [Drosophila rhopaloa]|uniref:Mastermind-like protein 2 n=1 Tax=Drosophila rhopaloa TaxID=1041015 RepID=A0A6P4E806_DRORH|nr:mastermind-like protein 2 [Drosophila rhopaloa]XP_016972675.1 mastermind-like protein 2 [Drosophila rhopaloa]